MQCPVCKNDKFNVTEVGDETVLICTRCGEDMLYCEDDEEPVIVGENYFEVREEIDEELMEESYNE